tara:strand:- start:2527 stop:3333 length:807 start_codon:yes stop_codon:yes gene_type:complete
MKTTNNCDLCGDNRLKDSTYCQHCNDIMNITPGIKGESITVPINKKKTLIAIVVLIVSILVILTISSVYDGISNILFSQTPKQIVFMKRLLFGLICMLLVGVLLYQWNEHSKDVAHEEDKIEEPEVVKEDTPVMPETPETPELEMTQPVEEERELGEVFYLSDKSYTYNEARAICKKYGADLASPSQVYKMYTTGTSWCKHGWSEGQHVIFPATQKSVDEANSNEETKGICGKVGLNGMFERDTNKKYGVNCWREGTNYPSDIDSSGI